MKISIIIPTINEHSRVENAVKRAWSAGADEVVVVDGGSQDGTLEILDKLNCVVINSAAGRAKQLNAGALAASGDTLLFVHADNWLEANACDQIRKLQNQPVAGAFRQQIENKRRIYRWIEAGNAWRVRWRQLAYGDQGMFFSRQLFEKAGRFDEVELMEDYLLSRKLKKIVRLQLLPGKLHLDARRWEKNGPIRQTLRNWLFVWSFFFGAKPTVLAAKYRRHDQ